MPFDPLVELGILVRSRYGIIILNTADHDRADAIIRQVATQLSLGRWRWTRHSGLERLGAGDPATAGTDTPMGALRAVAAQGAEGLFIFAVHEPWLEEPGVASALSECGRVLGRLRGAVLLVGDSIRLAPGMSRNSATITIPHPTTDEYRKLLDHLVRDLQPRVEMAPTDTTRLVQNLRGLTTTEARRILTRVMLEDGRLSPEDIDRVTLAKRES
ncbi:MAG: hypothetical protein ACREL6_03420, partial [Gemmatimonadales bacterium]